MNSEILFSEKQHFRQLWLWIILAGINMLTVFGVIKQLLSDEAFGDKPMTDIGLAIVTIMMLLLSVLFYRMRLETYIKTDGIYVRFFPFHKKLRYLPWSKIQQCVIRQYRPIGEYGGWGIRGFSNNKALNVSGNKGIQLVLKDGSRLLIGTNKADEANAALKKAIYLASGIH